MLQNTREAQVWPVRKRERENKTSITPCLFPELSSLPLTIYQELLTRSLPCFLGWKMKTQAFPSTCLPPLFHFFCLCHGFNKSIYNSFPFNEQFIKIVSIPLVAYSLHIKRYCLEMPNSLGEAGLVKWEYKSWKCKLQKANRKNKSEPPKFTYFPNIQVFFCNLRILFFALSSTATEDILLPYSLWYLKVIIKSPTLIMSLLFSKLHNPSSSNFTF